MKIFQEWETIPLKDSGERQTWQTGSQRDTREGKGRFDLISPRFLKRLALVLEKGAVKYGDRNWEKGQPLSRYLDSALRHINCYLMGMRDEDHLAQAAWNLHSLIHTQELVWAGLLPPELDDLPGAIVPDNEPEQKSLADMLIDWLSEGPVTIQHTFDHFRSLGYTDDEVLDAKESLEKEGKVTYCGNASYMLTDWKEDFPCKSE